MAESWVMKLDAKYLAEIKARHEAATPEPWKVGDGSVELYFQGENSVVAESRVIAERAVYNDAEYDKQTFADIAFIAAARTDIPALLAEVERLTEENIALQAANDKMVAQNKRILSRELDKDQQIAMLKKGAV